MATRSGRLTTIPSKHSKLMVVLDHLAQQFEPGKTYPEVEVNERLARFHPDYAALRRYLVENRFMAREDSVYWRSPLSSRAGFGNRAEHRLGDCLPRSVSGRKQSKPRSLNSPNPVRLLLCIDDACGIAHLPNLRSSAGR